MWFSCTRYYSAQYASAMAWLDCGLKPAKVTGHCFGQLTAMCVSGVLSLKDGLRLVTERAGLIKERWDNDPGSMIAIEADPSTASRILTQHSSLNLDIACYNATQCCFCRQHLVHRCLRSVPGMFTTAIPIETTASYTCFLFQPNRTVTQTTTAYCRAINSG